MNAIIPIPRASVSIREATPADIPFIDSLQKIHRDRVGFMATTWLDGKIAKREIIVAEDSSGERVGYCMGVDKYSGREDVGIIHQLNVVPGKQRGFIGATLLRAMFERAAYGCRLFCCWCAQDIEANHFWESMGFVALAYRAGSEKKSRVHIFWQKRIREGDTETPWWFPSETNGGAIGEARLVLPIPPGKRWSDEMPVILPKSDATPKLDGPKPPRAKKEKPAAPKPATNLISEGGMRFAPVASAPSATPTEKPKREK